MPRINSTFNVEVYGEVTPYSQTMSLARARILYKYANRNSTYITDEFADKLLSTLAYTPVKGIYDEDDFSDHGERRSEGRIYGVVPQDYNLTWEDHLDSDGVVRNYACADVLLFTAIYPEAKEIPSKGQSMEIYTKSIKGEWRLIDGKRMYVYTEGCFLGLQALGDEVEPCFEGAEFFSLYTKLKNLVDTQEGGKRMEKINFKLSDNTKHDMLFDLININYNREGDWTVNYGICEIYDDYALCFEYENGNYCRWYYQKDDSADTVSLGEKEYCKVVDITETEYKALNLLKAANENTFERVDEVYTAAHDIIEILTEDLNTVQADFCAETEILNEAADALFEKINEIDEVQAAHAATISEKEAEITSLTGELSTLKEYKNEIESAQKDEVITRYSALLTEEVLAPFVENKDKYDLVTLKKELAFITMEENPSVFSKEPEADPGYIPTGGGENLSEATKLIMKHKKQ